MVVFGEFKFISFFLLLNAICYTAVGQLSGQQSLQTNIPELITKLNENCSDSEVSAMYMNVIKYYNGIDNDSTLLFAKKGLETFKNRKYKTGQARMVLALADYDDTHGNTASSSEKVKYALSLFNEANDKQGIADASNLFGVVEAKKGNYDKAVSYFIDAQKIYSTSGNKKGLLGAWINLGLIYDFMGDSAKLFYYYGKADSISRLVPLTDNIIHLYNNLGESYLEHHDTTKGLSYMAEALKLSDKPEYMFSHIICLINLGVLTYGFGKKEEGTAYLRDALTLAQQHHLPDQEAGVLINFVTTTRGTNKDSSILYLNRALKLVQSTGNKPRQLEVYRTFVMLYESEKKYEQANKYIKLANSLSDSLGSINKAKEIANMAAVYDLQLSNAKVIDLEALILKNKHQKKIIIVIGAFIMFLFAILYFFFMILLRYYRKVKKLNRNLEEGKRELAQLNNMKDKLFSVIGHDLRGPVASIPVVIDIIVSESEIPESSKEILLTLKDQTDIIIETLDKLILLGKSVMKGKNINQVYFEPKPLIAKSMELLTQSAKNKGIVISDFVPQGLIIYADTAHFEFVIRNLLSNAIKFSFTGGKIEVDADTSSNPEFVLFSVRDFGTGINEKDLIHMFKSTVTSKFGTSSEKGTGIGLMLCEEFVTLNGGRIWVESKVGEGSVFYFSMRKSEK